MYRSACKIGVTFIKYDFDKKPQVDDLPDGSARVMVFDHLSNANLQLDVDLVVLVLGMTARYPDTPEILNLLKVPQCGDGFCLEKHIKLAPLETNTEGIYLAGCLQAPKDLAEALDQGSGAAIKSAHILNKDVLYSSPISASVDDFRCRGCHHCEEVCEYNAVSIADGIAKVNPVLCKGCGSCVAACSNGAMSVANFGRDLVLAMVNSSMEVQQ
jgi:heterodisulfide reductase subunit A